MRKEGEEAHNVDYFPGGQSRHNQPSSPGTRPPEGSAQALPGKLSVNYIIKKNSRFLIK